MALFKISRGSKNNLPTTLTEGYCWYTYEDSMFYIDFKDANGVLTRKALNAKDAETLDSHTADEFLLEADIDTVLAQAKSSGEFDGEDGYTPVRGTDYWTDADKAEIKSYVDEAILNGEW